MMSPGSVFNHESNGSSLVQAFTAWAMSNLPEVTGQSAHSIRLWSPESPAIQHIQSDFVTWSSSGCPALGCHPILGMRKLPSCQKEGSICHGRQLPDWLVHTRLCREGFLDSLLEPLGGQMGILDVIVDENWHVPHCPHPCSHGNCLASTWVVTQS